MTIEHENHTNESPSQVGERETGHQEKAPGKRTDKNNATDDRKQAGNGKTRTKLSKERRKERDEYAAMCSQMSVGDQSAFDEYAAEWDEENADEDVKEGLWALAAVRAYLDRIGAKPRSIKRAWIIKGEGRYTRDVEPVTFAADGTVTTKEEYAPTKEEQDAICEEAKTIVLPHQVPAPDDKIPDLLADLPPECLFCFKNVKGKVIAWQERRVGRYGKRSFHFWTFYSDGHWRNLEPEGGLPVFGLERLNTLGADGTVYVHEGAKAARAMQSIKSDHPWFEELHGAVHLGWVGGAPNPYRTDWKQLADPRIKRVVIVPDNDPVGRSAVTKIARALNLPTYQIQFTDEFPVGFDLADDFPKEMFGKIKVAITNGSGEMKESIQYVGPTHDACLHPATWLTSIVPSTGKGRPSYKLRKSAQGQWVYVQDVDKYACLDRPELRYKAEALDKMLRPFSDTDPMRYVKQDYSYKVHGLCYRPDHEGRKIVTDEDGPKLNIFRGCSIKPVKGDATPWLNFLRHLIPIEEEREFLQRLAATLIAHPEISMKVAILLVSKMQGTGKSTFAKIMKVLVGAHNASEPTADTIVERQYTDWLVFKRLIIVHEIYEGHSWKAYNKLKTKITEETAEANLKYEPSYDVRNYAAYILCSNAYEALKIEDQDRRVFVPTVTETALTKEEARKFYAWLESGGYAIIRQWALDYGNYLPNHCEVPMTNRKAEIIGASRSEIDDYAEAIVESMQKTKEGSENKTPMAVSAVEVHKRAKLLNEKDFTGVLSVKHIMADLGLSYLSDKIKVNKSLHRLLLNSAAVAEICHRFDCCYSPRDNCFVTRGTRQRLPIKEEIAAYLRTIYKKPEDLEAM